MGAVNKMDDSPKENHARQQDIRLQRYYATSVSPRKKPNLEVYATDLVANPVPIVYRTIRAMREFVLQAGGQNNSWAGLRAYFSKPLLPRRM